MTPVPISQDDVINIWVEQDAGTAWWRWCSMQEAGPAENINSNTGHFTIRVSLAT
jgi:hypothetical protein